MTLTATRPAEPTLTPTPTETETFTPTATPDEILSVALQAIQHTADGSCNGNYYPIPKTLDVWCNADACSFDCDHHAGHRGGGSLVRYRTRFAAATAFRNGILGEEVADYSGSGFPAWFQDGGQSRKGRLQANCWVAYASSFDDTHFRIAPQPPAVIEGIYENGLALGLFSLCPPLPPEIEAAGDILEQFSRHAHCAVGPLDCTSSSCRFACTYGPGHDGAISIHWFRSAAEAETRFAQDAAAADQPLEDFHGFPAVFWSRDHTGLPYTQEEYTFGVWRAGCWVISISSFDDTSYRIAPVPRTTAERIYTDGNAADLFSQCSPSSALRP